MRRIPAGLVVLFLLALVVGGTLAAKPPPNPPPSYDSYIYYTQAGDDYWWRMAPDGTGKTQLAGLRNPGWQERPVTAGKAGGNYWCVRVRDNTETCEDGYHGYEYCLNRVDGSGDAIVWFPGTNWRLLYCNFRPGNPPSLTFEAVHWDSSIEGGIEAGLFEVGLTTDGSGAFTGFSSTAPTKLLSADYVAVEGGYYSRLRGHAWIDADDIVYIDHWGLYGSTTLKHGQIHYGKVGSGYSQDDHAVLSHESAPAGWALRLRPDGARAMYANYDGLYEIALSSGASATCLVATKEGNWQTGNDRPCPVGYLDTKTIVYNFENTSYPRVSNIFTLTIGKRPVELTRDVEASTFAIVVR